MALLASPDVGIRGPALLKDATDRQRPLLNSSFASSSLGDFENLDLLGDAAE